MAFYPDGLAADISYLSGQKTDSGYFSITPIRVKYVFLDLEQIKKEKPKLYDQYQGDFALGGILFDSVSNPTPPEKEESEFENFTFALPLFPNFKQVPLVNEIAYIISFPSPNLQNPNFIDLNNTTYYYFLPINLWNNIHHNALPDPTSTTTKTTPEQKSYQQVEAGSRVKTTDGVDDISLGQTFNEQPNIKNLQPYEGDVIFEGRWGQSLRFSSTVQGKNNTWSQNGPDGKPITILRNGQYNDNKEAWVPTVENINLDSGSIYLTTEQKIPLEASSTSYKSYNDAPILPKEYALNQIILSSGRLVLNSSQDHILLSSKLSVGLNAIKSINLDSPKTIITSDKIYLGDKEDTNTQPILLGQDTVNLLSDILSNLSTIVDDLSVLVGVPPGSPFGKINADSTIASINLKAAKAKLNTLLSKTSRTK
jgi:hypothetical protein